MASSPDTRAAGGPLGAASGRCFEQYVMVDWSAGRPPRRGANSIWVATTTGPPRPTELVNPSTPDAAIALVDSTVDAGKGRVLVGIDACLGFPAGLAGRVGGRASGATSEPWRDVWRYLGSAVASDISNRWEVAGELNELVGVAEGPFWGHVLGKRKPKFPVLGLCEWRQVEVALRAAGLRPTSPWQAAYAGAVGLQSITAIALLDRWRRGRTDVAVWPFQPCDRARVVVAEVYPSMFAEPPGHPVRDARQVQGTAGALALLDRSGELGRWLSRDFAATLPVVALSEEGWTLGVEPQR